MDVEFLINGNIDLVAVYAATLSTLIAVWEIIKWRVKNAIDLKCVPNMMFTPSLDTNTYVVATVTNKGETQTTITHYLGHYWPSWTDRLLRRNKKSFVVMEHSLPAVIQPGGQWMGKARQDDNMEKMASEGLLYLGVNHSMGNKEVMRRIRINHNPSPIEKVKAIS